MVCDYITQCNINGQGYAAAATRHQGQVQGSDKARVLQYNII